MAEFKNDKSPLAGKGESGEWKTVNGAHIFIEDGQSVESAMAEKFDKGKPESKKSISKNLAEPIGTYLALDDEFNVAVKADDDEKISSLGRMKEEVIKKISTIDKDMATALVLNTDKVRASYKNNSVVKENDSNNNSKLMADKNYAKQHNRLGRLGKQ